MPTTLFGLPAVEVEQPDGEIVKYLTTAIAAPPDAWRQWVVTSPKGDAYHVIEYPSGRWTCDCPAHTLGKNRGGRWQKIKANPVCKHTRAVWDEMGCDRGRENTTPDRRAGQGSPGTPGGGGIPPTERADNQAADCSG